ncbi:hypothetical protein JY469_04715 [Serratia marcescens]|nr:hypothetical protein [Serratia marcescens]
MARNMPAACPKCGSKNVIKERIMGAQTGDWICSDCSTVGQLNGVPIGTVLPEHKDQEKGR